MTDQEKLQEYVNGVLEELTSQNKQTGQYCMLVEVGRAPRFAYRDIAHFQTRVLDDLKTVDPSHSVEFACLIFED